MPSPLQKSPAGLLQAFNIQTLGQAPYAFGDTVVPHVESFPFYSVDRKATGAGTGAAAAYPLAIQHVLVAPVLVHNISAEVVIGAAPGTRLDITIFIRCPSKNNVPCFLAQTRVGLPVTTQRFLAAWDAPGAQGMLLPAGATIEMIAQSDAAGADHTPNISFLVTTLTSGS